ncbi:MAG: DUF448 domain-containing protein [Alphaproteobacteria bacterium]|nr:DUF448 domain-containing protein [Alphaproteobacteria bacterium]
MTIPPVLSATHEADSAPSVDGAVALMMLEYERPEERGVMRRSVASGESLPKKLLLRFVVAPNNELVFDPQQRLPGRGYYIESARVLIEQSLKKRLFSRAARRDIRISPEFLAMIEDNLLQRCLSLIGMARRGGMAVMGYDKVVEKLNRGGVGLIIQARDAAIGGRDKIRHAGRGIPEFSILASDELAQIFGRDRVVHVAISSGKLAEGLKIALNHLQQLRPCEDGCVEENLTVESR